MGDLSLLPEIRAAAQQRYERTVKENGKYPSALNVQFQALYDDYTPGRFNATRPAIGFLKGETDLYWQWRVIRTLRNMVNETKREEAARRLFRRIKDTVHRVALFEPESIACKTVRIDTLVPALSYHGFGTDEVSAANLFLSDFLPINSQVFVVPAEEQPQGGKRTAYSFELAGKNAGSMQLSVSTLREPPSRHALLVRVEGDGDDSPAVWLEKFMLTLDAASLRKMDGWANTAAGHMFRMLKQMKIDVPRLIQDLQRGETYTNEGVEEGRGPVTNISVKADLWSVPQENFTFGMALAHIEGGVPWIYTVCTVKFGTECGHEQWLNLSFPKSVMVTQNNGTKSESLGLNAMYSLNRHSEQDWQQG